MRQLQEVKVRGQQQLEAEKVRGQQQVAMEKVRGQQLEVEKRKAEAALAALYHAHQEEKTRERERVKMFYIGIQQKKISMLKLVLARFRVVFLPEEDSEAGTIFIMHDDGDEDDSGVMTAIPSRLFRFTPYSAGDIYGVGPFISAIVATQDGQQLVMTDFNNNAVKVADVTNPRTVLSVTLDAKPYRLALLRNGRVAVTAWNKRLYLIDVSGHPTVVSRVQTSREYRGVSAGTTDDTLIVSCDSDSDGPASVDVISYEGRFRHTVVDSNTLRDLQWPEYLAHVGGVLLVSDYASNSVFRVDLASGRVLATLAHPHMQSQGNARANRAGNLNNNNNLNNNSYPRVFVASTFA
nr:hypothetical protein BaRGS_031959 [Batillaria attramentaria]